MPLPELKWSQINDRVISVTTPTYDVFLNKIEECVNAGQHWRVNAKNFDAPNSRGWIELAPKSALAGVTEGRVLILFSTGTVAGTAGNERPLQACRNAPWAGATTSLAIKMWLGFSPDANSALGVGPANDPWVSATPYGATNWSKLFPLHALNPAANALIGLQESAEGVCIFWTDGSDANDIQYVIAGRLLEEIDGETAHWMISVAHTMTETAAPGTAGWGSFPASSPSPPLGHASRQHSTGEGTRSYGAAMIGTTLYGLGRTQFQALSTSDVLAGMSNINAALFQAIILGGGPYFSGSSDSLLGIFRQVRWGPAAYRGQQLISGGVTQGINLNYASASAGAKPWGLWFDNFR